MKGAFQQNYSKEQINTRKPFPGDMHCLCYPLQDKTIYVTGDAYGTLKFYSGKNALRQVKLADMFKGAVIGAMTVDPTYAKIGVLIVAFEAQVNSKLPFASKQIAPGARVGQIVCLTLQGGPVSELHRVTEGMHGKPLTVPFAHNKQITALKTIRKGDKLILISASKTLRCTGWVGHVDMANKKIPFKNYFDFSPHFGSINSILHFPEHPQQTFFTTASADGRFKVHSLGNKDGKLKVQSLFCSHELPALCAKNGPPYPIVDMTKSVEGPSQYLVIACKDPTPEKKHCLKLYKLKTAGGISLEPMKLYPMLPFGDRRQIPVPTRVEFRGKLRIVNSVPEGQLVMASEGGTVKVFGKDWLANPRERERQRISFNRPNMGMDHNLSRYENANNKHITDIAVGPRGQLVMVSRFGRVGFLVESEGGAGAMGFDSAAASRSPW